MTNATIEQIDVEFQRQCRLCSSLSIDRMLEIVRATDSSSPHKDSLSSLLDSLTRQIDMRQDELRTFMEAKGESKLRLFIQEIAEDVIEAGAMYLCNFDRIFDNLGKSHDASKVSSEIAYRMRQEFTRMTGIPAKKPSICRLADYREADRINRLSV